MIRSLVLALLACLLVACGPEAGGAATPREATVVIQGERLAEDNVTIELYAACLGVAVGPEEIRTSDHCPEGMFDGAHVVVTARMWDTTARGNVLADTVSVRGEVRVLKPRAPVGAWISVAAAGPGEAKRVVVRDTELVELATVLSGDMLSGGVDKGDSGGPLFQGPVVGLTHTCNGTAEDLCDKGGGRFSAP